MSGQEDAAAVAAPGPECSPENRAVMERAHVLARSGNYEFVYQIERALVAEGFSGVARVFGRERGLRMQLRDVLHPQASRVGRPPAGAA